MTREVVISCIIEFFGEHGDLKELKDNDDQTGIKQLVMAVIVTKTGASSDSPKDIRIVTEGEKVVTGLLAVTPSV
ncbi:hypothetical protein G5714_009157 [Onychostoma macrolepis]|uniref:Uncharacterized protein n=1 Tax=Onychostoma macrolepis TaxID=369639 RepID=A0A7J6CTN7_9TELE|nr:hypothetical protein G5714_009157 [Onychostoma macrolepis]